MFKKMNRKGFTLVEIIAALVILGLLVLIAVPAVTKQLDRFRTNYYLKLEDSLKSAGKEYISDKRYGKPTKLFHSRIVKIDELEEAGYIDEVKDYLGKKCDNSSTSYSYVIVVKTGTKEYDYQACLKCSEDEYITDTTSEKNNYCDPSWLNNDTIKNELNIAESEKIYVYYGTIEEELKDEVALTYEVIKKNDEGEEIAKQENKQENDLIYPVNISDLVGKSVGSTTLLKYILPDGSETTRQAVIYKHDAPKVEMTYSEENKYSSKSQNDKYNNETNEWASGLTIKFSFSDLDKSEIKSKFNIKNVEYYDETLEKWVKTSCHISEDKKSCIWFLQQDFDKELKFRIVNDKDKKGDASNNKYSIKIDTTKPNCTLLASGTHGSDGWYIGDVELSFETKIDDLSGIGKYDLTDSETQTFNNNSTATLNVDTASKNYYGHVMDKAGNTNTCKIAIKRDTTKPTCGEVTGQGDINSDWALSRTVTVKCINPDGSECNPVTETFTLSGISRMGEITITSDTGTTTKCQFTYYMVDNETPNIESGGLVKNDFGYKCPENNTNWPNLPPAYVYIMNIGHIHSGLSKDESGFKLDWDHDSWNYFRYGETNPYDNGDEGVYGCAGYPSEQLWWFGRWLEHPFNNTITVCSNTGICSTQTLYYE